MITQQKCSLPSGIAGQHTVGVLQLGEDEIEELLEYMDVDGNHMVDYHEFVMGTLEDKQLLTEAKLRAAFDYFDSDRNGYIDIGEVCLTFGTTGTKPL